jgi:hypothetical protein
MVFLFHFCDVAIMLVIDHLQEDLAKFGYRSERKIEKFKKNPAIYIYILATCWNLLFKYDDFWIFFPLKICDFGTYIFLY